MAQLMQPFDARQVDPTQSAGSLPAGVLKVVIENSELKQIKDGGGAYLHLALKVIEGPAMGVSGQHNLSIYHSKPDVAQIANKQLSAVCHVTQQFNIADSSQLHNIPFFVEVVPQKDNPQYTQVAKVYDLNGIEPGKTAPTMPAPGLTAPGTTAAAPAQGQAATQNQQGWQQPAAQQPAANQQQQWQQPAAAQNAPAQGGGWQQPQGNAPAQNGAPAGWQQPQGQQAPAGQQQQQQWQQNQQPQGNAPAAWGQR